MRSRRKETKSREPTKSVSWSKPKSTACAWGSGHGDGAKRILLGWEHESVILLLVAELLFWLMYAGCHVLLTIIFTSVPARWNLP